MFKQLLYRKLKLKYTRTLTILIMTTTMFRNIAKRIKQMNVRLSLSTQKRRIRYLMNSRLRK